MKTQMQKAARQIRVGIDEYKARICSSRLLPDIGLFFKRTLIKMSKNVDLRNSDDKAKKFQVKVKIEK